MSLENFLTIAETAQELRCHPDTVTAMIRRGDLKAVKLGRAIRVVSDSIYALANHSDRAASVTATEARHD